MSDENEVAEVAIESKCSAEMQAEAAAMGWIGPDRFDPESGKKFVDADAFMERNPLYKKHKELHAKTEKLEKALGNLLDTQEQLLENERKQAKRHYENELAQLKKQKADAISSGDGDLVSQLDDRIDTVKDEMRAKPDPKDINHVTDPEFKAIYDSWLKDNDWYLKDDEMTIYADAISHAYVTKNPTAEYKDIFDNLNTKVKKRFPEAFENTNRHSQPKVEGDSDPVPKSNGKLTSDEKAALAELDDAGIFNRSANPEKARADYIKRIISLRE